jgi:hypothetical protein
MWTYFSEYFGKRCVCFGPQKVWKDVLYGIYKACICQVRSLKTLNVI